MSQFTNAHPNSVGSIARIKVNGKYLYRMGIEENENCFEIDDFDTLVEAQQFLKRLGYKMRAKTNPHDTTTWIPEVRT